MQKLPRAARPPAPAPLAQAVHRQLSGKSLGTPAQAVGQDGFSLVEVMLGIAALSVISLGTYAVYNSSSTNARVRSEQDNIQTLVKRVDSAYGATGSFSSLTTVSAIASKAVPPKMVQSTSLKNAWGSGVDLAPVTVDSKPNAGFKITYQSVPEDACAKLATGVADGMWDIVVNGASVMSGHKLNTSSLVTRCAASGGSQMVFTYYGGATGLAVTAPVSLCGADPTNPLCSAPPPPVTPPTTTPTVTPPAPPVVGPPPPPPASPPPVSPPPPSVGLPPPVATPPPASPPPASPPPTFCPPVAAATTPKPARDCTVWIGASAGSDGVCEDGATATGARIWSCPAGQLISSPGPSLYAPSGPQSQTRNESHVYACTDPWNASFATFKDVWTASSWNPWFPTYACAPQCSAPAPTTTPYSQTANCPAGQVTAGGASSFTQNRTGTITYSCSTPIGPVAPAPETYTTWSPTVASMCSPACAAPPASTATRTSTPCPAGQSGTITEQQTTTWTCPSPTGAATSTTSPWTVVSNTCAANCVAPANTTASRAGAPQTQTLSCPAGQTGAIQQSRTVTEYQTVSYSCPAPTGAYSTSYGAWGTPAPTYGAWTTTSNTCTPTAPPPPSTPPVGCWVQTSYSDSPGNCNVGDDSYETANWSYKGYSGMATCTTDGWSGTVSCMGDNENSHRTAAYTPAMMAANECFIGDMRDSTGRTYCSGGYNSDYNQTTACGAKPPSGVCPGAPPPPTPPPPPPCGPAPATATQTISCPAGQSGSITQTHGWSSAPSPTCWTAQPWTTTSNTCTPTAPPPPSACPAGQTASYGITFTENAVGNEPTCSYGYAPDVDYWNGTGIFATRTCNAGDTSGPGGLFDSDGYGYVGCVTNSIAGTVIASCTLTCTPTAPPPASPPPFSVSGPSYCTITAKMPAGGWGGSQPYQTSTWTASVAPGWVFDGFAGYSGYGSVSGNTLTSHINCFGSTTFTAKAHDASTGVVQTWSQFCSCENRGT